MKYDLIIIGSGSVGAAAGYYATRAGLNVLMTDAHMPPHQHGSHHGDTRLIRHAYGEGESMSRWSSARKRCGMNFPATTKMIPFLYALVSLTSARLTPHFSPTSPTAPNSGNSTLKSSMRKGLWPAGQKYASRTTTSAYLRLIPVFCAANWRLKPGSTGEGSGLCATVQLPGHRNSS